MKFLDSALMCQPRNTAEKKVRKSEMKCPQKDPQYDQKRSLETDRF